MLVLFVMQTLIVKIIVMNRQSYVQLLVSRMFLICYFKIYKFENCRIWTVNGNCKTFKMVLIFMRISCTYKVTYLLVVVVDVVG